MDKRKSPSSDSKDKISGLPDSLIHSILSFTDMRYAVQTCVFSKRWRYIWTSLPTLNFGVEEEYSVADFVDKVLRFRDDSCCIRSFRLDTHDEVIDSTRICSWIAVAGKHNVEELDISCLSNGDFVIPPCLCTCKSLTKLDLHVYDSEDYRSKIILPTSVSLPGLKSMSLNLENLLFDDEYSTNKFFSSCPALESLDLGNCEFSDMSLNISSLKLEHFSIENPGLAYDNPKTSWLSDTPTLTLTLYAPNLTTFTCTVCKLRDYSLENLSSLVSACIYLEVETDDKEPGYEIELLEEKKELYALRMMKLVRTLHNVKVLTLSEYFKVLSEAPEILDSQLPQFLNLQRLWLTTWLSRDCVHTIIYFLKISPNIESLCLDITAPPIGSCMPPWFRFCDEINDSRIIYNPDFQKEYRDSRLSLPCVLYHLKFVKIQGLLGRFNELKFIEILLKNSIALEKLVLFSIEKDSHAERRMMKFNEILLGYPRASTCTIMLNPSL
ncbi:hypothetical protein MKW98_026588 [Papaver atlanticum]|uniref:FBD domain-containing protein n=1 Tax=Papaver atlanticum TaxID=357466 RepID=A0AAD4S052_9MAGN|nr:hypothetical protein MKW98_026588 [Papaver atlanticum]